MKTPKPTKTKPMPVPLPPPTGEPAHEEIVALAHLLWEEAGRPEGRELDHWLAAEARLRQTRNPQA